MPFQASLEYHIRRACRESNAFLSNGDPIFYKSTTVPAPILTKGAVNAILLFPGAFNPPHLGHLQLLETVLQHSARKYVAVIILPYENEKLAKKLQAEDISLTILERTDLWRAGLPKDLQPIVWPSMMGYDGWDGFLDALKYSVFPDAEIEADILWGPDNTGGGPGEPINFIDFGIVNVVTSDVTREWWIKPQGKQVPWEVDGCLAWERLHEEEGWQVWRAQRDSPDLKDGALFYVESPNPPKQISSTKIRELMKECGDGEEGLAKAQEDPLWQQIVGGEAFARMVRMRW